MNNYFIYENECGARTCLQTQKESNLDFFERALRMVLDSPFGKIRRLVCGGKEYFVESKMDDKINHHVRVALVDKKTHEIVISMQNS